LVVDDCSASSRYTPPDAILTLAFPGCSDEDSIASTPSLFQPISSVVLMRFMRFSGRCSGAIQRRTRCRRPDEPTKRLLKGSTPVAIQFSPFASGDDRWSRSMRRGTCLILVIIDNASCRRTLRAWFLFENDIHSSGEAIGDFKRLSNLAEREHVK